MVAPAFPPPVCVGRAALGPLNVVTLMFPKEHGAYGQLVFPMATAFAYWAAVEVGRSLRATTMSMILLAVPGLGLLLSAIALHESIDVSLVLGIVLIGTGIGVVTGPGTLARRARAASGIFPLSST